MILDQWTKLAADQVIRSSTKGEDAGLYRNDGDDTKSYDEVECKHDDFWLLLLRNITLEIII